MGQLLDGSWVTKCDPLSALHRVAYETSLNQMADNVDDEQYAKFANSVKPISQLRYDYDTTTTKNWHVHFCSRRMASNGSRRARYVVVGS